MLFYVLPFWSIGSLPPWGLTLFSQTFIKRAFKYIFFYINNYKYWYYLNRFVVILSNFVVTCLNIEYNTFPPITPLPTPPLVPTPMRRTIKIILKQYLPTYLNFLYSLLGYVHYYMHLPIFFYYTIITVLAIHILKQTYVYKQIT